MKFVDLFAGIGGFRQAFEGVGGECLLTSEIDKWAEKTYRANYKVDHEFISDVRDITSLPDHDVLLAGFPCQPFSIAGVSKKQSLGRDHGFLDKAQGTMFFELARLIHQSRPQAFLLENVKNILSHDKGNTLQTIKEVLVDDLGYNLEVVKLDAKSFVPQHRERVYFIGFRDPIGFNLDKQPFLKKGPPLRSILEQYVEDKYTLSGQFWEFLQEYKRRQMEKGNGFGYGLADLDGHSNTLLARYYKDGSEILVPQQGKPPRKLTPRECARLMGYSDSFLIPVSNTQAYKQFGNSVVVPVVSEIAKQMAPYIR